MRQLIFMRQFILMGCLLVLFAGQPVSAATYKVPVAAFTTTGSTSSSQGFINHGVMGQGSALGPATAQVSGTINLPGYLNAANATLDADGDLYANLFDNCWHIANGGQENYDQDVWGDICDLDDDNDTLVDAYELRYQMNPLDETDVFDDIDGDGITNLAEAQAGSDPTRVGSILPGYQLPKHITPLMNTPEDGPVDGQRALPK